MVANRHASTHSTEALPSLEAMDTRQGNMLTYNRQIDRWEGGVEGRFIWMEHSTFLLYVNAYLEFYNIVRPTVGQMQEAVAHCARFEYWNGCERFYDRRVHVQRSKIEAR